MNERRILDQIFRPFVRQQMARLDDQDPDHQHVIVGRSAAPIDRSSLGRAANPPEHLELDDRLHPFHIVALDESSIRRSSTSKNSGSLGIESLPLRFSSENQKNKLDLARFLEASSFVKALGPFSAIVVAEPSDKAATPIQERLGHATAPISPWTVIVVIQLASC